MGELWGINCEWLQGATHNYPLQQPSCMRVFSLTVLKQDPTGFPVLILIKNPRWVLCKNMTGIYTLCIVTISFCKAQTHATMNCLSSEGFKGRYHISATSEMEIGHLCSKSGFVNQIFLILYKYRNQFYTMIQNLRKSTIHKFRATFVTFTDSAGSFYEWACHPSGHYWDYHPGTLP